MKLIKTFLLITCILAIWLAASQARAQGTTAFTYQGQLHDGGTNANGNYTMIFVLYDSASGGNSIGTNTTSPTLANGLFSVNLDFGNTFNGNARWLDITITNGGVTQTLSPRVQVLPAPYAQFAAVAATVTNGGIMSAQLAGNAVASSNIQNGAITNRNLTANAVNATNIASGQVVKSLNSLMDNVVFTAGANAALFTNGNSLQLSAVVPNMQIFFSNGTFTAPTNVTKVKVEMWGGGGGGGSGTGYCGGGGAGGYAIAVVNVTPGAGYGIIVGAGGSGGGSAGGNSFFGSPSPLVTAGGGAGGATATSGNIGAGGQGGLNGGILPGGTHSNPGNPGWLGNSAGGSGGSAFQGGAGGLGFPIVDNDDGNMPGGGGGGDDGGGNPGNGAQGLVIVSY